MTASASPNTPGTNITVQNVAGDIAHHFARQRRSRVRFESSIYRDGDIVNLQQVMADVTKGFKYDQNNVINYIYMYIH